MENLGEKLGAFWRLVVDVWENGVLGVDIGTMAVALGVFVFFLVIRRLFTRFVIGTLRRWTRRTATELDDKLLAALQGPIRFLPIVLGVFFAAEYLHLSGTVKEIADNLVRSLIAYAIFWGFHALVGPLSFLLARLERVFTSAMVDWLVKAIKAAIIFIGGATILEIWGIAVAPIIAGLGLVGVAVALGAQDLFKNLIAGILIIAEKRFHLGDWIRVDGVVEGTVETIGFRSTVVRRFDKAPVYVPNSKLSDNAVTNFTAMSHRRISWIIGVEYRTTVDQLRRIRDDIESYIRGQSEFASPPAVPTFVRIDRFSDSSIDILVYCFTVTTNWGEWLEIKERLAYRIKEIVEGAGSAFAFPSQSIYVETVPPMGPEVFIPPGSGPVAGA